MTTLYLNRLLNFPARRKSNKGRRRKKALFSKSSLRWRAGTNRINWSTY